jgi:hypothetical protein
MPSQEVLKALEGLHLELEKLQPAIKHIETAQTVTETVKSIPQKHIELVDAIKQESVAHKNALRSQFEEELKKLSIQNEKAVQTTIDIQQQVKLEQLALEKLKEQVQAFHDKVDRISFPERLDKVDATVSGIMAAVQATQSRLDNIERNLMDRMKEVIQTQKESLTSIQESQKSSNNKLLVFSIITWVLVLTAIGALFFK